MWYYNLCAMTYIICCNYADVAELADAPDLGSGGNTVQVQVLFSAPKIGIDRKIDPDFSCNQDLNLKKVFTVKNSSGNCF